MAKAQKTDKAENGTGGGKARASFYLSEEILERARNATYWASPRVTLNELVERGLEVTVGKLEQKHGGPFPPREK